MADASLVSLIEDKFSEQLGKLIASLTPKDLDATLSILRRIFGNIIEHPNNDEYRQIKVAGRTFSSAVWQYPAGRELMKISGWALEDDHIILRDESCVQISYQLVEKSRLKIESAHRGANKFAEDEQGHILGAVICGNGLKLKQLLDRFSADSIKRIKLDKHPLLELAFWAKQIGIIRILVDQYGLDVNVLNEDGVPCFLKLFDRCDSSEACQAFIIQSVKEFNIDVEKGADRTALHLAVLHKHFTVIKFLVEECKVNVNRRLKPSDGTPLHMACGMGEKKIAQYLIDHGADQEAMDDDGKKPKDYQFYEKNQYALASDGLRKSGELLKNLDLETKQLMQVYCKLDAILPDLLESDATRGHVNQQLLESAPTMKTLNQYITDMAPSFHDIGLQLDIVNSQLKLIKNNPNIPDLREKCHKMLEVWLENDTSATYNKLFEALKEAGLSVLAGQIKESIFN